MRAAALNSACECSTQTYPAPLGDIVVLRVAGAIDLLTHEVVDRAVTAAVDEKPANLVVDLSAVDFCSVRGFTVLTDAEILAEGAGIRYAVSGLSEHLGRVATMVWEPERPTVYRSIAAAVTAIRARQVPDSRA